MKRNYSRMPNRVSDDEVAPGDVPPVSKPKSPEKLGLELSSREFLIEERELKERVRLARLARKQAKARVYSRAKLGHRHAPDLKYCNDCGAAFKRSSPPYVGYKPIRWAKTRRCAVCSEKPRNRTTKPHVFCTYCGQPFARNGYRISCDICR